VLGALNLCQALASTPPKLFVGFSSIIGVTGMMGNAWYGFSNESLNLILHRFEAEHPETSVIAIAFSIWDEVGMGARMGSVDTLAKMGIGAIPKEEGVRRFLQLVQNNPSHRQVIVAARLGNLDTWRPERPAQPSTSRFLEAIVDAEPGVEVLSRVHLSLDRDPYVQDHIYNGSYLFPTVFGLEAMSQAVSYAAGESRLRVLRIQDIRLERPIVVDPEKGVNIEIHAEVFERDSEDNVRRVHTGIRTEQTGFTTDHFSATFVLDTDVDAPEEYVEVPETPLDIQPKQDLYGGVLFQGPRFQRLQQIYSLDSERCVFRTEMQEGTAGEDSFSDETLGIMMPGDPFFRDTLLQVAQLCASPDICLPVFIESIELYYFSEDASGLYTGVAVNEGKEGQQYNFSVLAVNEDGRVIERLKGYRAQILRRDSQMPTAEELADPSQRDEQKLRDELASRAKAFSVVVPNVSLSYLPELHKLSREERHQYEMPILRHALRRIIDGPVQFRWLDSGKPVIDKIRRN
jgi:enediyne polyketide synthase